MRTMPLTLSLMATLVLAACGDDDGAPPTIGRACGATMTCASGEMCLADQPGGLCTRTCAESGSPTGCGAGFMCDRLGLSRDGGSTVMTICLELCERPEDCRLGYACSGVSGGSGSVCQPM